MGECRLQGFRVSGLGFTVVSLEIMRLRGGVRGSEKAHGMERLWNLRVLHTSAMLFKNIVRFRAEGLTI